MFIEWFEGCCPECRLADEERKMVLNCGDLFECPHCGLQICVPTHNHAVIMKARGTGRLLCDSPHTVDTMDNPKGRILSTAKGYGNAPDDFVFFEEALRAYLTGLVDPRTR